ncbi:MAG TPA: hypothetical protein PKX36_06055 [Candidatus Cloacimonadota bacterium]|nr:hypothetical protein [Candidatus Cloacimonadota bacterium]
MKKIALSLMSLFLCVLIFAQDRLVSPRQAADLALANAKSLWGDDLYPGDATPLYGPDDSIVAWLFDYSLGKPFPSRQGLMLSSAADLARNAWEAAFRKGEYAYMLVGAHRDLPVLIEFSRTLSPQIVYGEMIAQAASQAFPDAYELGRTYYMGPVDLWTCVTDGHSKRYINVEPRLKVLDEEAFRLHLASMQPYWERDNFDEDWASMLDNGRTLDRNTSYIPNLDKMPFYIWHEGCAPTSGAMLASWWDEVYNLANLDKYHMTKWDIVQDQYDHHVTDMNLSLHNHMDTDGEGSTSRDDICDGYENAFEARGYGCESDGRWAASWEPRELMENVRYEISENHLPLHTGIPNHAVACVGYSDSPDIFYVHDPNNPDIVGYNRGILEAIYWVHVYTDDPGDYGWVQLSSLNGGTEWGNNDGGETLNSGDVYEITWDGWLAGHLDVRLYYHAEGGANPDYWIPITMDTENDGLYEWLVPAIDCFYGDQTDHGRIKIELYDPALNRVIASDGSFGNFKIRPGGSLTELDNTPQPAMRNPDYFTASLYEEDTWYAISLFDEAVEGTHPWDIELYDNTQFAGDSELFSGEDRINFVVINNHQLAAHDYGIKVSNVHDQTIAFGELTPGGGIITPGTYNYNYNGLQFAYMHNLSLAAGNYFIETDVDNATSTLDLDIALYAPGGDGIFGYSEAMASSSNSDPGGTESFNVSITQPGIYGLCVSSGSIITSAYTLRVYSGGKWTGLENHNWHNPDNWLGNTVPTQADDVLIPDGCPNDPYIYAQSLAAVRSLTLAGNAALHVQTSNLSVYGNFQVLGTVHLENEVSTLEVTGNLTWEANSSLVANTGSNIVCYGSWTVKENAQIRQGAGTVIFVSDRNAHITNLAGNTSFFNLTINKQSSATLYYSGLSTQDLKITGQLSFQNGYMGSGSQRTIILQGQPVFINGGPRFDHGTFKLDGYQATLACPAGTWFHNLMIDTPGACALGSDLDIHGDLLITAGALYADDHHLFIKGSFYNEVTNGGFLKGTSTVTFDGGQQSECVNVEMHILELSNGTELHFDSGVSFCDSYIWTSGTLYIDGGTLNILDMAADGVYGNYTIHNGYLYITQDSQQRLDLRGILRIHGGLMRVSGGYGGMTIPWGGSCELSITGGILDFPNSGFLIQNSGYALTTNLSGGTIKLAGNLACTRDNFLPTGTTFQVNRSSSGTQTLYCVASSRFSNLVIDSGLRSDHSGLVTGMQNTPRAEVITLMSDINVYGDLIVSSGTLDLSGFTMQVGSDIDIHGNLVMDSGTDLLVAGASLYWFASATGTISTGEIRLSRWLSIDEGAVFQMNPNSDLRFVGEYPAFITNHASGTTFGDLYLDKDDAQEVTAVAGSLPFTISGNLYLAGDNYLVVDSCSVAVGGNANVSTEAGVNLLHTGNLEVQGNYYNYGFVYQYLGDISIGGDLHLNGSMTVGDNNAQIGGKAIFSNTSVLNIGSGIFRWEDATSPYSTTLNGTITIASGLLIAAHHSLVIGSSLNFSPGTGTISCAGFAVNMQSLFNPGSGTVRITAHPSGAPSQIGMVQYNGFNVLKIDSSSGAELNTHIVVVNGLVDVITGRLDTNGHTLKALSGVTVRRHGILEVDAWGTLQLAGGQSLIVQSGGVLQCLGEAGSEAEISAISGFIGYDILSGAFIAAREAIFRNMNIAGVQVQSGATVDPNNCFANCTFTDGANGTITNRSRFLLLNSSQDLTVMGAEFPQSLSSGYNVAKSVNSGSVYFLDAIGAFSGESYDADPYDRIHWGILPPVTDLSISLGTGGTAQLNWSYPLSPSWFNIYSSDSPDLTASPIYLVDTVEGTLTSYSEPAASGKRFYLITATQE